jgi:probable O-glycosylation ligase (exosortase A-associated)
MPDNPSHWNGPASTTHGPHAVPGLGVGRRSQRLFYWSLAVVTAVLFGLALIYFPPLLVVGAIFGLAGAVAILRQPYVGLIIYAVVYVLRPGELYPILSVLRLERVVAVITLACMAYEMYRLEGRLFVDRTTQTKWLFVFLVAVCMSVPTSYWPTWSVDMVIELLKIIAFYLMIVHLANTRRRVKGIVWTYLLLVFYLAMSSLKAYYSGNFRFAQGIDRAEGLTSAGGDPNALAATIGSSLALYLLLVRNESNRWLRGLALMTGSLSLWTISLTGSRSGVLAVLAALIFLWWRGRHRFFTAILGLIFLVGAYSILPEQYQKRYSTMTDSELDASSTSRITAWKRGFHMLVDHPLFGVGIGNFGTAHAQDYSPPGHKSFLNAHNLWVQVFAETGLVGAGAFIGFMISFFRLNRRAARATRARGVVWRFETATLDGLLGGFICLLVTGMFGHSLLRGTWYIFAALGLAVYRVAVDTPPQRGEVGVEPAAPVRGSARG